MPATILLVDDNAVQAAIRQAVLKRAGYNVVVVLSSQRALDQLRNHEFPYTIDLVLTDHMMPGMDGTQFVARIREFMPDLPVMVLSGMPNIEDAYAGLDVHFRNKPLLPSDLLATVHTLLELKP